MERTQTVRADEMEFVARLQAGEPEAYERLVSLYSNRLIAIARQILGDEDLARDAVQDAFLSAFRAMSRFNGDAQLSSWLHRIVTNAALAKLRVKRRRPECFITEEFGIGSDADPLDRASHLDTEPVTKPADAAIARQQEARFVRDCIASLKENHRSVLTLRYIKDCDTEQTARILGIRPNTVKTRLMRARDALRSRIVNEAEHTSPLLLDSIHCEGEQSQAA
jgi:RNA polymerase sigma-70 factor (ECF subfamily)